MVNLSFVSVSLIMIMFDVNEILILYMLHGMCIEDFYMAPYVFWRVIWTPKLLKEIK